MDSKSNWQNNIESGSNAGENIKRQGSKVPGIDYGDNLVSRKKNYDNDGNTIDDMSESSPQDNGSPSQNMSNHSSYGAPTVGGGGFNGSLMSNGSPSFKQSNRNSHFKPSAFQSPNPIFNGIPTNKIETPVPQFHSGPQNSLGGQNAGSEHFAPPLPTHNEDNRNFMGGGFGEDNSYKESIKSAPKLSYAEKQKRKEELLAKLARLESRGYKPIKNYSLTSELEEIEEAYSKTLYQSKLDNAIKLQGKCLVGLCNFIEFMNNKFDYFGIYLNGWSEAVFEDLDSYDEVFEELYEKYKDQFDVSPEVKLVFLVVQSAAGYHMTHKLTEKAAKFMPNFEQVMNKNPELKKEYTKAASQETTENMQGNPFGQLFKPFMNTFMGRQQSPKKPERTTKPRQSMNYDEEILNGMNNHNNKINKINLSEMEDPDELSD